MNSLAGIRKGVASVLPAVLCLALLIIAPLFLSADGVQQAEALDAVTAGPIYAPGTDPAVVESDLQARFQRDLQGFQTNRRWFPFATALDQGGSNQGDSLHLTWSIMPDGTFMNRALGGGDQACNSNLISKFNARYGRGNWQAEIQRVFDDWSDRTGNTYSPAVAINNDGAPIDDGASFPSSGGIGGVRGDIRIGGCTIDGDGGALAYAYFPGSSGGDMKIDSDDNFYSSASLDEMHSVVSHELGHAVGLFHVCPVNQTKLMEPFASDQFVGLQHDDIRGIQRFYGDRFEQVNNDNDSRTRATELSFSSSGGDQVANEDWLSLDANNDLDWFEFEGSAGDVIDLTVDPRGRKYLEGGVSFNGCGNASTQLIDSNVVQDVQVQLRLGSSTLRTVGASNPGNNASLNNFTLPADGTYQVRVQGINGPSDGIQLYDLEVRREGNAPAQPVTIGNFVWNDLDGGGRWGGSREPGIGGVEIQIRNGQGAVVQTTTTSNSGYWTAQVDPTRFWSVHVDIPNGFAATQQFSGSNTGNDSNIDADGVFNIPAGTLTPGVDNKTFDAGFVAVGGPVEEATIGNRVWHDLDRDGIMDNNEPGIGGITVLLLINNSTVEATRTTSANGFYNFKVDPTRDWRIQVVVPAGFSVTDRQVGSNSRVDSDAYRSNARIWIPAGTLDPGERDTTFDTGLVN